MAFAKSHLDSVLACNSVLTLVGLWIVYQHLDSVLACVLCANTYVGLWIVYQHLDSVLACG